MEEGREESERKNVDEESKLKRNGSKAKEKKKKKTGKNVMKQK